MRLKTLLTSLGLGAGLMYFYDPQRGELRRSQIRDRFNHTLRRADESIDTAMLDLRNRARGSLLELTARLDDRSAPDWILEERVRSRLGRVGRHARALDVRAQDGRIILKGPALREDAQVLMKIAARTPGVSGVDNQIHLAKSPEEIPARQGIALREGTAEWQQSNWSPAMRLVSGLGGGLLALYGMTRRGLKGMALGAAGTLLAARSVTNLDARSLVGAGLGSNAIKVRKTINIYAPIDEVYAFWSNFENFPLFMSHIQEIHTQDGQSHWKVSGPAGSAVEFQAQTMQNIPNQLINWETIPGSQVHHAGRVRFDENPDGSTRVSVEMNYTPPAGALGHAVARLFGVDPRQAMHDDLVRLKSLLEQGKTSTDETVVQLQGQAAD